MNRSCLFEEIQLINVGLVNSILVKTVVRGKKNCKRKKLGKPLKFKDKNLKSKQEDSVKKNKNKSHPKFKRINSGPVREEET